VRGTEVEREGIDGGQDVHCCSLVAVELSCTVIGIGNWREGGGERNKRSLLD
jgi:hypothetical protein